MNRDPLLFLVDDLCASCPSFVTPGINKKWRRASETEILSESDHFIENMKEERVVVSVNRKVVSRKLKPTDTVMWDGSYPENMPVDGTRMMHGVEFDDDDTLDPIRVEIGTERVKATKI